MTESNNFIPIYVEIAQLAGVSIKTVCNVIRTPEIVRKVTRRKVLQAIKELGVSNIEVMHSRLRPAKVIDARRHSTAYNG